MPAFPSLSSVFARIIVFAAAFSPFALPAQTTAADATKGTELSRTVSTTEDGRPLIIIRSLPPRRRPTPTTPIPSPSLPSASERLEELRLAAKKTESFSVAAVVYAGSPALTELRWTAAGREWLAYSNVDFHALTQIPFIETADTVYQWFPFVSDGDPAERPRPPGLTFSGPEPEYLVYAREADWAAAPEAFVVLDWLHGHYEANRATLDTALALRRAEAARRAATPPPPPKPVVIRYYAPAPVARPQGGAR
jgi:hypothetical protein